MVNSYKQHLQLSAQVFSLTRGLITVLQVNAGIAKLTVGRPEDDAAIVPVVSESSAKFVEGLVMDAKEKGATLCQEYKREVCPLKCCSRIVVGCVTLVNGTLQVIQGCSLHEWLKRAVWLVCRATSFGPCCWTM
jgi:hypothetical protein